MAWWMPNLRVVQALSRPEPTWTGERGRDCGDRAVESHTHIGAHRAGAALTYSERRKFRSSSNWSRSMTHHRTHRQWDTSAAPSRGSRSTPATTSCSATAAGRRRSPTWSPSSATARRAATPAEAAAAGDIVVVTVPLKAYRQVPVEPLRGKIVIDTNNYYPQRDGHIAELDDESTTVSELLQAHLPESQVVKAFNNIYFRHLGALERPSGDPERSRAGDRRRRRRGEGGGDRVPRRLGYDASTSARSRRAGATSATPPPTARPTRSRARASACPARAGA